MCVTVYDGDSLIILNKFIYIFLYQRRNYFEIPKLPYEAVDRAGNDGKTGADNFGAMFLNYIKKSLIRIRVYCCQIHTTTLEQQGISFFFTINDSTL